MGLGGGGAPASRCPFHYLKMYLIDLKKFLRNQRVTSLFTSKSACVKGHTYMCPGTKKDTFDVI